MADREAEFLDSALRSMNVNLAPAQLKKLVGYVDLLERWNQTYNLTAIRDRHGIFLRHVLESLAVLPFIGGANRIDVGTGAGIPGIPLAIADGDGCYTLIDSNGKKTRFLAEVKRQLGLTNIRIETARIESWVPDVDYDAVLTRAFADLETTLTKIDHVLGKQGSLYAMTTDSVAEANTMIPEHMHLQDAREFKVPGQDWSFNVMKICRSEGMTL